MNYFLGHLIKINMAHYIYIHTYKIPAYSGTGDNVDTFFIQYSKNIKKIILNFLKLLWHLVKFGLTYSWLKKPLNANGYVSNN